MPTITDWLMVGITLVYVIATIAICVFNYRSAKATKEQVDISKIQFEETQRIQLMPLLEISVLRNRPKTEFSNLVLSLSRFEVEESCQTLELELFIKNIGLGTAKEIEYTWVNLAGTYHKKNFPVSALCPQADFQCYIDIIASDKLLTTMIEEHTKIVIHYKDLLNNAYEQIVNMTFSTNASLPDKLILSGYKVLAAEYKGVNNA